METACEKRRCDICRGLEIGLSVNIEITCTVCRHAFWFHLACMIRMDELNRSGLQCYRCFYGSL